MRLLISHKGNLGTAIAEQCKKDYVYVLWHRGLEPSVQMASDTIAVYVGRGQDFGEFLDFCLESGGIPVLQCSSDVDPRERGAVWVPVVDVPNAAESVFLFMCQLGQFSQEMRERGVAVEWKLSESHQRTKDSPPGTALRIAAMLGIPPEKIYSVRRRSDRHSKHIVHAIVGEGDERYRLECEVLGLEPYAKGIIKIAKGFARKPLQERENRIYTLDQFEW